jgi:predicted ATPase
MARLDRLGTAKEVAQIGAAIGREFSHALLAAVVHKSDDQLGLALDRLIQSGLLSGRVCRPMRPIFVATHTRCFQCAGLSR